MSGAELTSVAYKKGNLLRYTLWGVAVIAITVLIVNILRIMNTDSTATPVPDGYRFAVNYNYAECSKVKTTYYVYDNKVIVEDESFENNIKNRSLMVYEGITTSNLEYNEDETTTVCELGACREQPKVLTTIKKLISRKVGREYLGY